jgi:hypothetical protein
VGEEPAAGAGELVVGGDVTGVVVAGGVATTGVVVAGGVVTTGVVVAGGVVTTVGGVVVVVAVRRLPRPPSHRFQSGVNELAVVGR